MKPQTLFTSWHPYSSGEYPGQSRLVAVLFDGKSQLPLPYLPIVEALRTPKAFSGRLLAAEVRLSKLHGSHLFPRWARHKRCRLVSAFGLLLQMHFNRPATPATERASIQQDRGIFRLWPPLAL